MRISISASNCVSKFSYAQIGPALPGMDVLYEVAFGVSAGGAGFGGAGGGGVGGAAAGFCTVTGGFGAAPGGDAFADFNDAISAATPSCFALATISAARYE
jgi:hypothetical protein